ncbi:hypothetical protein OPQ81_002877 [Rhizoctonia solani]|nr:hypothetical protein OPQ81_002877 [Rhizoctonia solani]
MSSTTPPARPTLAAEDASNPSMQGPTSSAAPQELSNNADGADTSANTNAQAIATPARGNNKCRGNMQASRGRKKRTCKGNPPLLLPEDTDNGVQPTTDEES